jgi:hypothetical protein
MAIANADHDRLLLTPDLLQRESRFGLPSHRLDSGSFARTPLRFPPIEDLVSALDRIAQRETAA